ncbi:MAG: hypothetical protein QOK24_50 [Verrucomicrobiota bacterium]|jgi:hypothetical protein
MPASAIVRRALDRHTGALTERAATNPISASANSKRARTAARLFALFLGCFIVTAVAYHRTNITFFRAESGWYQFLSHEQPEVQRTYLAFFFTHSYHGHYTPVAFAAEFALTRLAGPHANFWKWRQLLVLSILASAIFLLVCAAARPHRLSKPVTLAAASAVTALFVLQPLMRELVAWPFMVMQLGWMICATLTLLALVQFAAHPEERRWIWFGAAFAYASMHWTGLGAITAAATLFIFYFFLGGIRRGRFPDLARHRRPLWIAVAILLGLAALQGLAMIHSFGASKEPASAPGLALSLGFWIYSLFASVRTLVGPQFLPEPDMNLIAAAWPYGLLAILILAAVLCLLARSALRDATPAARTRFVLQAFSITSFAGFVFLMLARRVIEPGSDFRALLIGSRYLVPITFTLLGSAVVLAVALARRGGVMAAIFFVCLSCAALAANRQHARQVYPAIYPLNMIDHEKTWQSIVAVARECEAAGIPIPNVPMGRLIQEFYDWDLRLFEPLLRDELKLTEPCRFADWADCRGVNRAQYDAAAPSLRRLTELLGLNDPP